MARKEVNEYDISVKQILGLMDQDIAQHRVIPLDADYVEKLKSLVDGVSVDLDQILPDDDVTNH